MTDLWSLKSKNTHPELAGRRLHFGGWGSYEIPFVPQEPIDEAEAHARRSYYVGHYDGDGRLARFEKFLDGEPEWSDEYAYWDNGRLKERVMLKSDGAQIVQRFNPKGKPIDA